LFDVTFITAILIGLGGVLMFCNILKSRSNIRKAQDLLATDNQRVKRLFYIHQSLMLFFLLGYFFVLLAIMLDVSIVSTLFTGVIFFFGALFVFNGISLQADMILSIRQRHAKILSKNEQLIETENVTIFALAYQAEIRDGETGQHLDRTASYVKILAEEMCKLPKFSSYLTHEYIVDLVKSAPLHDIGKVGIPDMILGKTGKLSPEEFKIIQEHCSYGAHILEEAEKRLHFRSFLTMAISLVISHHERWDGKGYPNGLKEEEIPLSGRIMALADVYDALRSKRCYKEPFSHEKSRSIIVAERGMQFDPDVIEAFLKNEEQFKLTATMLTD
jgi:response regulator RpfG family c-di-GMP phosphodiesterase